MLKQLILVVIGITIVCVMAINNNSPTPVYAGGACFLKGESVDGLNKVCYYNCSSGTTAITVRASQLCPITIRD